jgi:hypothetical protein
MARNCLIKRILRGSSDMQKASSKNRLQAKVFDGGASLSLKRPKIIQPG